MKKLIAIFRATDMSEAAYRQVMKDLEQSGAGSPEGRLSHTASLAAQGMVVIDQWESPEALQQFAETLMPILVKNGVTPPQPEILPLVSSLAERPVEL